MEVGHSKDPMRSVISPSLCQAIALAALATAGLALIPARAEATCGNYVTILGSSAGAIPINEETYLVESTDLDTALNFHAVPVLPATE